MKFLSTLLTIGFSAAAAVGAQQSVLDNRSLPVPGDNPLEYCESPDDEILTIKKVDLSPNPPEKGKDLLITASGTLSEEVEEGAYVLLQVKFGLIKLINANESLCEQLEKVDRSCPLEKGELTFQRTVTLPSAIPPGKFTVSADVYTKTGEKITCMEAKDIKFDQVNTFGIGNLEL